MKRSQVLTLIAQSDLNIPTLRTRKSDGLDFHEVFCESVLDAMQKAYVEGYKVETGRLPVHITMNRLAQYGCKRLDRPTLLCRKSDSLDFFEVSVWGVKEVLEYAYDVGKKDGKKVSNQEV